MTQSIKEKIKEVLKYKIMEPKKITLDDGEEIYFLRHKRSRLLVSKELFNEVIDELEKEKQ